MKKFFTIALAAVAASAIIGCGSKGGPELAVVNGESISMDEYYKNMERMPTVRVQTAQGPQVVQVAEPLGFQALQQTIYNKVLLQLAKDEGVYPSEKDILAELEFQKQVDKSLGEKLKQSGITIATVKEQLLVQLAQEKIITKGITITMPEVDQYIKDNPAQFTEPAKVNASWVYVTSEEKKKAVDEALAAGGAFGTVAMQFSEAPQAKEFAGRFPVEQLDAVPAPFDKIVKATSEGTQSAWTKVDNAWVKFFVERKTASKPMVIDDLLKKRVQRKMAMDRGTVAVDLDKRITDRILKSKITVQKTELQESWKRLVEEVKKRQATVSSGNAPTSGGSTGSATGGN